MTSPRIVCLHGWGGSADDFEVLKFHQLAGQKHFARAPLALPWPEFEAFLRRFKYDEQIISMLESMDHFNWCDKSRSKLPASMVADNDGE